jgi:hypothetical protein
MGIPHVLKSDGSPIGLETYNPLVNSLVGCSKSNNFAARMTTDEYHEYWGFRTSRPLFDPDYAVKTLVRKASRLFT